MRGFFILGIVSGLWAGCGHAAPEERTCVDFLARLRQSTVVYRPDCCNMNVSRALKELGKWEPDFNPDQAEVLILRPAAGKMLYPLDRPKISWAYHVVLLYEGRVLDLDHPGAPLALRDYLQNKFLNVPQKGSLRKRVDRMVGNPTPWDNLEGMTVSRVSVEDYQDRFPQRGFRQVPREFPAEPVQVFLEE